MKPMNLRKRNGVFHVWFERSVQHPNGKLISLKTADETEAKEIFRILQKDWHERRVIELDHGKQIKLSSFKDDYIKARADLSDNTLRMDDLAIRMLIDAIGDVWIKTIGEKEFNRFKKVCSSKGRSKQTVNAYLRHIKAAINYAADLEYIKKAPKIKMVKTGKHLPRILTKEEREKILARALVDHPEMHRVIVFAMHTGCRRSEIMGLQWQDINGGSCRVRGKGDKDRFIPLLPAAMEALGEPKDIGPVFYQKHIDYYSKDFKAIAVACGINDVHFHNLRHSAATQMIESGIPIEIIKKILGHADIRTTEIYAQIYDSVVEREMNKLRY